MFPFRPYYVEPSPAHPSNRIWRPIVPVRIAGPSGTKRLFGLLDTGADETTLPMGVATELGVEIAPQQPARFEGLAGQQTKGFYGKDVCFELKQGKKSYRWINGNIAFLYDPPDANEDDKIIVTLGHVGFFRYFNVAFDHQRSRVKIRPNGLFRQYSG